MLLVRFFTRAVRIIESIGTPEAPKRFSSGTIYADVARFILQSIISCAACQTVSSTWSFQGTLEILDSIVKREQTFENQSESAEVLSD